MTEPIQKSLTVPLRPQQAFELFSRELATWWPVESHSLSAANGEVPRQVEVEEHVGGQIVETLPDGRTDSWGTVTRWEPGQALGIAWHVGRDASEATDIMVTFTPVDHGTQVELTHGGFDRLGETATAVHGQYQHGWDFVLGECYRLHCQKAKALA